ncbi:coil containing protein [Vibrio phage 137E35-1]|nr:coil containing protein [Vibrio phage 137E35-1]CAH9016449.1 coil containing protein [Vibrio phage 230E39-1]
MKSNIEQDGVKRDLKSFNMSKTPSDQLLAFNKKKHRDKQRAKIARCGSLEELARKRGKKV